MELNDKRDSCIQWRHGTQFIELEFAPRARRLGQNRPSALQNMLDGMEHYGSGYSNWALLLQRFLRKRFSVKVHGAIYEQTKADLLKLISPQVVLIYDPTGENGFVVCGDGMCWPKVKDLTDVISVLT